VVKIKKYGGINKLKPKENVSTSPEEDLEFLLWKEELYKELTTFWKAISK
jgi:hypothetical protein